MPTTITFIIRTQTPSSGSHPCSIRTQPPLLDEHARDAADAGVGGRSVRARGAGARNTGAEAAATQRSARRQRLLRKYLEGRRQTPPAARGQTSEGARHGLRGPARAYQHTRAYMEISSKKAVSNSGFGDPSASASPVRPSATGTDFYLLMLVGSVH